MPELFAVWSWMEAVREGRGCQRRLQDVDVRNGVALCDVLGAVAGGVEAEREVDEGGRVARRNLRKVRDGLGQYPWVDPGSSKPMTQESFQAVDACSLGGFILLAAVTGQNGDEFMDYVEELDAEVQGLLDDVLKRAMCELGMTMRDDSDRGERKSEGGRVSVRTSGETVGDGMFSISSEGRADDTAVRLLEAEVAYFQEKFKAADARAATAERKVAALSSELRVLRSEKSFQEPMKENIG